MDSSIGGDGRMSERTSSVLSGAAKRKGTFVREVRALMYGFGDDPEPDPASVLLMEEMLQYYLRDLCEKVTDHAVYPNRPKTHDFLAALRNDPKKLARAYELLAMDKELKSARAAFDVTEMTSSIAGNLPPGGGPSSGSDTIASLPPAAVAPPK